MHLLHPNCSAKQNKDANNSQREEGKGRRQDTHQRANQPEKERRSKTFRSNNSSVKQVQHPDHQYHPSSPPLFLLFPLPLSAISALPLMSVLLLVALPNGFSIILNHCWSLRWVLRSRPILNEHWLANQLDAGSNVLLIIDDQLIFSR